MRPRTLLALLLVVPFLDALFLVYVATQLGGPVTVALVVLTAILGMLLLRAEGRATLARVQRKLARGEPPTDELLDGGFLIAAGAFLLTPGLLTDLIGFLFAFPITRVPIRMAVKKWIVIPYIEKETGGFATGNVYIGGFPSGDFEDFDADDFQNGGFGPGANAGFGDGPDPDDTGGPVGGSSATGSSTATGDTDDVDDVVDVEFSVEDEANGDGADGRDDGR